MNVLVEKGYALAEGARWVGGRLVYVDILDGSLYELGPSGPNRLVHLDVPLGAVAPVAGGGWIVAAGPGIARLSVDGALTWLDRREPPTSRMNDGVCDPQGRFWAGSMAYDEASAAGSLYRVDGSGVTRVLDGLTIVNGPAFSADGAVMYVADTAAGVIYRCDGDGGDRRTFVEIPPAEGLPDGMTVDDAGRLWVALWGGSAVRCYNADGTVARHVDVPAPQPTSVCLAEGTLYVTTAATGLTDPGPASGAVLAVEVDATAPPAFSYTAGL